MARYIIRRLRIAHCKRGPSRCEQCRELEAERICLLDIRPPREGEIQRRVIPVHTEAGEVWCEFDIVRTFDGEEDARAYAARHKIEDVAY